MSSTRTGGFGIGFRRGWSDWQKDLGSLGAWAVENGFACLDVKAETETMQGVLDAGLAIGSVDLPEWKALISPDKGQREAAIEQNTALIAGAPDAVRNYFVVMLPEKPDLPREENFAHMVEGYGPLMEPLATRGARIVIEGWPGPGALCCTPETIRAFFKEMNSPAACFNYDPSHLIRLGVDPLRFLHEFAPQVGHVHGKDTELLAEGLYEHGCEQPPAFRKPAAFGGMHWRYTIPGQGAMRWGEGLRILADAGYEGCVSIELEDANFNGSEAGEKEALLLSRRYLEGC